jgi:hypothetical protein
VVQPPEADQTFSMALLSRTAERSFDKSLYDFANFIEGRGGGIEPKVLQERRPLKVSFRQGCMESE